MKVRQTPSQHMILSGRPFDSVVNAKEFIEYIEANEIFTMSSTNKVCSGPLHMVNEFVVVALNGQKITSTPHPNLESIIGDMDTFFDYSDKRTKLMMVQYLLTGLLEVVWVYLDHFRAPATCRSGLSGAGIPRLAVRMHVAG